MPERNRLKQTIEELHQELAKSEDVDAELQVSLKQLEHDIDQVLHEEPRETQDESLVERAEEAAVRFSVSHPRLEMILNEIAETLGRMGI